MNKNYNFYPFNRKGDHDLVLVKGNKAVTRVKASHSPLRAPIRAPFNGYVVFHKKDIPKSWWGGYSADALQYLNIHGGITYHRKEGNYVVFGFDCAHLDDEKNTKLFDENYVMQLTEQMEEQIMEYKKVIKKWRKYGIKRRCRLLDGITTKGKIKEESSFGKNIDMLSGCQDLRKKY